MIKKILAGFLALCLISSLSFKGDSAYAQSNGDNSLEFLKAIEIIPEDLEGDNIALRADFAVFTMNLLGESFSPSNYTGRYSDVLESDSCARAVETLTELGYLSGYSDGTFLPQKPITAEEAIKVLVEITGHRYMASSKGGYPNGYILVAKQLGILRGIDITAGMLTIDTLAKLINNTFDVELVMTSGVHLDKDGNNYHDLYTEDGRTILTEYLKLYRGKGIVKGNEITNLTDISINENEIIVGGVTLSCSDAYADDFLGHYAEYVYKLNEEKNIRELKYIHSLSEKTVVLVGQKLVQIDGMEISYEENDKTEKLTISPVADIIYNNDKVSFDEKYFNNTDYSKITLIENTGDSKIDFIKIEVLQQILAGTINAEIQKVTDLEDYGKTLNFDQRNYKKVIIMNAENTLVDFNSIMPGMIITYIKTNDYLKCYLSEKVIRDKITSISNKDGGYIYKTEEEVFSPAPGLEDKSALLGKNVIMYIDAFGNIAHMAEDKTDSSEKVGFLLSVSPDFEGLNKKYYFNIYTKNDVEEHFLAAEKVLYNGEKIKKEALPQTLNQTVVLYELNENNEITRLEQPVADSEHEEGRLRVSYPKAAAYFYRSNNSFGSKSYYDGNTLMFSISSDEGELVTEDDISILDSSTLANSKEHTVETYDRSKKSMVVDAVVVYGSAGDNVLNGSSLFVVSSFEEHLVDEDVRHVLTGYNNGVYTEFYVDDEDEYLESIKAKNPEKGDVIRYGLNGKDELRYIETLYKVDGGWQPGTYTYPEGKKYYSIPFIIYAVFNRKTQEDQKRRGLRK